MLSDVHLMSWNVAGWKKTHDEIARCYPIHASRATAAAGAKRPRPSSSSSSSSSASSASIASSYLSSSSAHSCSTATCAPQILAWLDALRLDVLFIQEHKLQTVDVAGKDARLAKVPGWSTFWACNDGKGAQRAGLNGVCTFSRDTSSFRVRRADSAPLRMPELDNEGRCLLTDHGAFLAFNVYAPNISGGKRYGYRLRFLAALRRAMHRERAASGGRPVILLGDLNLKARPLLDQHWQRAWLDVDRLALLSMPAPPDAVLRAAMRGANEVAGRRVASATFEALVPSGRLQSLLKELGCHWPAIKASLRARTVEPYQTQNTATKQTFDRFRTFATPVRSRSNSSSGGGGSSSSNTHHRRDVQLGSAEHTEGAAWCHWEIDGIGVNADGSNCVWGPASAQSELMLCSPGQMNVMDFQQCASKLVSGWTISDADLEALVMSGIGATVPNLPPKEHPQRKEQEEEEDSDDNNRFDCQSSDEWLAAVTKSDDMLDSFAALHPHARGRFTCWNQYKNARQENFGGRLDYFYVDRALWTACEPVAGSLDSGVQHQHQMGARVPHEDTCTAALWACTLQGRWRPAPTEGTGLPDGRDSDYLHHSLVPPHSGIVYTPPQWSDHVGVSWFARRVPLPATNLALTQAQKRAMRASQPHTRQRSIMGFFSKGKPIQQASDAAAASQRKKKRPKTKPSAKGLHKFFGRPQAP